MGWYKIGNKVGKFIITKVHSKFQDPYSRHLYNIRCTKCGTEHEYVNQPYIKQMKCCENSRYIKDSQKEKILKMKKGCITPIGFRGSTIEDGNSYLTVKCACGKTFEIIPNRFKNIREDATTCQYCRKLIRDEGLEPYKNRLKGLHRKCEEKGLEIEPEWDYKTNQSLYKSLKSFKEYLDEMGYNVNKFNIYRKNTRKGLIKGNIVIYGK